MPFGRLDSSYSEKPNGSMRVSDFGSWVFGSQIFTIEGSKKHRVEYQSYHNRPHYGSSLPSAFYYVCAIHRKTKKVGINILSILSFALLHWFTCYIPVSPQNSSLLNSDFQDPLFLESGSCFVCLFCFLHKVLTFFLYISDCSDEFCSLTIVLRSAPEPIELQDHGHSISVFVLVPFTQIFLWSLCIF